MNEVIYNKTVVNYEKLDALLKSQPWGAPVLCVGSRILGTVYICLDTPLSGPDQILCDDIITAFVDFTTAESLKIYLDDSVFPFINDLINRFAAENISIGITQAGKTGHVLGLFEKGYDVHANGLPISLKGSFDTGSLYESLTIISYIISNPTEIAGLTPFVTEAKLNTMAAEITAFLT